MAFQYLRQNSTPEKKTQHNLQRVAKPLERKLLQKVLDFLDRV